MRLPLLDAENPESVDREQACRMVDRFLEAGLTYFDTAYMYHHFQSERIVKEILVDRYPRTSLPWPPSFRWCIWKRTEIRSGFFRSSWKNAGWNILTTTSFTISASPTMRRRKKFGCFEFAQRLKAEGKVRHVGFSFHDTAQTLEQVLTEHPEVDFVQLQINYLDWEDAGIQSRLCYETAVRHGKPVVVMEPVKGGMLANLPAEAEQILRSCHPDWTPAAWALRFAAGLEQVKVVLSGMSALEQMEENLRVLENAAPLTPEEQEAVRQAVEAIQRTVAVPCTACGYCLNGCPQQIAIPSYFALLNAEKRDPSKNRWAQRAYYQNISRKHGKASDCVACGSCESICPQHLPIISLLQDVTKALED